MVYTQSHAAKAQMLNNRFQNPWQPVGRRCAERFVCQIVGLQGREGPRRGFWRPGGSGGGWPSKIGASPLLMTRGPQIDCAPDSSGRSAGWAGRGGS